MNGRLLPLALLVLGACEVEEDEPDCAAARTIEECDAGCSPWIGHRYRTTPEGEPCVDRTDQVLLDCRKDRFRCDDTTWDYCDDEGNRFLGASSAKTRSTLTAPNS